MLYLAGALSDDGLSKLAGYAEHHGRLEFRRSVGLGSDMLCLTGALSDDGVLKLVGPDEHRGCLETPTAN